MGPAGTPSGSSCSSQCAVGVFYFIGRELAQAEYKWINTYGGGFRKNMPWYGSLDYRVWDVHSWFWNLSLPIVIAALIIGFN